MGKRFSPAELYSIAYAAGVIKRMAANQHRTVTVDYVPGRDAVAVVRDSYDEEPLETARPAVHSLVYRLEDAMFGGQIYVALVVDEVVVVEPFKWEGYAALLRRSGT